MGLHYRRNSLVYFQSTKPVTTCKCCVITQLHITTQCLMVATVIALTDSSLMGS